MPIFIYDPDALDKLTAVEGESWKRHQLENARDSNSFPTWVRAWNHMKSEGLDCAPDNFSPGMVFDSIGDGAIYGEGGYARYIVRCTGEIVLLKWSTRDAKLELAKEVGFTVV